MLKTINLIGGTLLLLSLIFLFIPMLQAIGGILLLITFVVLHIPMLHKVCRIIREDWEEDRKQMKNV